MGRQVGSRKVRRSMPSHEKRKDSRAQECSLSAHTGKGRVRTQEAEAEVEAVHSQEGAPTRNQSGVLDRGLWPAGL